MNNQRAFYYRLEGNVKSYEWGEKRKDSLIYHFLQQSRRELPNRNSKKHASRDSTMDENLFAELWFGAHPQGSAHLISDQDQDQDSGSSTTTPSSNNQNIPPTLSTTILRYPHHSMGKKSSERTLPFLMKVLTAAQPLSIQAHPDQKLALELHARAPMLYPDMNHKPELIVCLENFSALIGFQTPAKLKKKWQDPNHSWWMEKFWTTPPSEKREFAVWLYRGLEKVCRADAEQIEKIVQKKRKSLRLTREQAKKEQLREQAKESAKKTTKKSKVGSDSAKPAKNSEDEIFLRLVETFGSKDRGVLFPYLMQFYQLKTGEAFFLPPTLTHAYLGGRAIECQANSNNVIRLGLTNKQCDLPSYLAMLWGNAKYSFTTPPILRPQKKSLTYSPNQKYWRYSTPADEFKLSKTELSSGQVQHIFCTAPSIVFCSHSTSNNDCIRFLALKTRDVLQETWISTGTALFLPGDLKEREILIEISQSPQPSAPPPPPKKKGKKIAPKGIPELEKEQSTAKESLTLYWCSMNTFIQ